MQYPEIVMQLTHLNICGSLERLSDGKLLINTINAWSYVVAQKDEAFAEALKGGDALIPDGQSIVWAAKFLKTPDAPKHRIAGWDLFTFEMARLQKEACAEGERKRVMFVGSSEIVLSRIKACASVDYPQLDIITCSPPFKLEFSDEDNAAIINAINAANPDLLWIGMTAPKQEKWAYSHWKELDIHCHCGTIGAVFDFYAGTVKRAPQWMQNAGLEWLYRLISNPKRLWKRYLIGNAEFIWLIVKEKYDICNKSDKR